jgi:hypothetical protein
MEADKIIPPYVLYAYPIWILSLKITLFVQSVTTCPRN